MPQVDLLETLGPPSKVVCRAAATRDDIPFEAAALELEYPFLGHRPYAHGSSMLEGMLRALTRFRPRVLEEAPQIRQFKVIRPFASYSMAEAMRTEDVGRHPRLARAAARLDVNAGPEQLTSLLFPTHSPIATRLMEYNAADYVEGVFTGENGTSWGHLIRVRDYIDLIRGINEVNRQLTVNGFPDPDWSKVVRWAYLRHLPIFDDRDCATMEKVSYRVTDVVDVGNHRFEIKEGILEGGFGRFSFEICFFIELPIE